MTRDPIKKIFKSIREHESNASYTQRGIPPLFTASVTSKIMIVGQAPGRVAEETKKPWNDKSGDQLRRWMDVNREVFYDDSLIALVPMDFYFPGKGKLYDLPPRKGFAELWHPQLRAYMQEIKLTLLVGKHAQNYYLGERTKSLTETVQDFSTYIDVGFFPLPHPSPRNNIWKKKNPWFEKEVAPALARKVQQVLG
jgi:uracil-DNA glycosylase